MSKPGALQVSGIDSLANFRLRLKHNLKEYRPKFLEQKQYISLDETEDYESYRIGLMPRLDQGEVWSRAWVANAFQVRVEQTVYTAAICTYTGIRTYRTGGLGISVPGESLLRYSGILDSNSQSQPARYKIY